MLRVNFLETTQDGQKLCGYLCLIKGKIKTFPQPGYKTLFENVTVKLLSTVERVEAASDPEKWMRSLPKKYSGAYLRAELVDK